MSLKFKFLLLSLFLLFQGCDLQEADLPEGSISNVPGVKSREHSALTAPSFMLYCARRELTINQDSPRIILHKGDQRELLGLKVQSDIDMSKVDSIRVKKKGTYDLNEFPELMHETNLIMVYLKSTD